MTKKLDLNGIWHNQFGSEMKLEVDGSGRMSGKFRTAIGRSETRKEWQDSWFDLVGFVNGDILSFVVNFSSTGAMFVCTGRMMNGQKRMETLSYTNYDLPEHEHWKSVTASSVTWEPGPAGK